MTATSVPASVPAPGFSSEPEVAPATLAPSQGFPVWPWLLAAVMLGAGGAFLFWRRNMREAYAGGPQADAFVAPEPAPAPRAPAPASKPVVEPAPAPAAPQPVGIVSTRLRPWIEIGFNPLRCTIEKERVIFEFELELFNSGSTPARAVLTRANMFNAGPTQDQDIGAFFADPVNEGERMDVILPMERVQLRPQLGMDIGDLRVLEAGGRKFFVPLIAFTILYERGGGWGQTSVAYLMGRDTKGEKMAPFRLDLGPRIFRGLKATPLPISVRN